MVVAHQAKRVSFDQAKKRLLELAKDYDRIAVRKHERKRNARMNPRLGPVRKTCHISLSSARRSNTLPRGGYRRRQEFMW